MNISSPTGVQNINKIEVVDISPPDSTVLSLDDRLRDSFSSASVATEAEYNHLMTKTSDPEYLSTPGGLFELQVRLGEYKQQVETISAVTRKGVAVAETLLRA